jgi:cell division protein FtsB
MRRNLRITWKQTSSTALLLFALSVTWTKPAQSQDSRKQEIQQLKDKLDQLDQMMNDVNAEIKALEGQGQSSSIVKPVTPSPPEAKQTSAQAEPIVAAP